MRLSLTPLLLSAGITLGVAQDVRINANSMAPSVLAVKNTASSDTSATLGKPAIYGVSQPTYSKGIGVEGLGASTGVYGIAAGPAAPGGSTNYRVGVEGSASGGYANIGVWGSAPDYAGYFVGNVLATGTVSWLSDSTLKTNIQPMSPSLNKLMGLKPKSYQMAGSKYPNARLSRGSQFGVIAQDVATVFPELVSDAPVFSGDPTLQTTTASTYKSVNYIGLIPILIKAVQEQQAEIDTLQQQIRVLKGQ